MPAPSSEAASRRSSSSGYRPANAPKPVVPVDSTATRSRSTTDSANASETPAASYVFPSTATESMSRSGGLHSASAPRSFRADHVVVRAAPARPDRGRSAPLLETGQDARAQGNPGRRVALLPVLSRRRTARRRACVADRDARRGGVVRVPHGAAPAARRPRAAVHRGRAHRADPPAAPLAARGPHPAVPHAPVRLASALGDQPLPLAPAVLLGGRAPPPVRARARTRLVLHGRSAHVGDRDRGAARPGVVRHGREDGLHRRGPGRDDDPRQRLRLGGHARSTASTSTPSARGACPRPPTRGSPVA